MTVVSSILDSKLAQNTSISVMCQDGHDSFVLIPDRSSLAIVDCQKLMKHLSSIDGKIDRTAVDYKIDHQIWKGLIVTNNSFFVMIWTETVVRILDNGYWVFVKEGKVNIEVKDTPDGSCPFTPLRIFNGLCMYGRGAYIWRDTLFIVSDGLKQLCSTDLNATIQTKKIVQVRHSIDCIAFNINRAGMTATVTADGNVSVVDLSRSSVSRIADEAVRSRLSLADGEACQAVGVSDKIILFGSGFRLSEGPQIQKITMMRQSGHRRPSSVEISRHQAYIHSIMFVERRCVQFAVVVNFSVDCHLLAVRHDSLQVVQQGVVVSNSYVNACCVYGESLFVVGQNSVQKVAKLDVVF